jgi:hypothetical protein
MADLGMKITVSADTKAAEKGLQSVADKTDDVTAAAKRSVPAASKMSSAFTKIGASAKAAGAKVSAFGKSVGGSSMQLRMLPQQFGQIAQQAAATGDVFSALSIQAFDIGAAFGTVGLAVGAVAGFAIPALIAAFSDAGEEAEGFADSIERVRSIADQAKTPLSILTADIEDLTAEFGQGARRAREWALAQAEIRVGIAQSQLRDELVILSDTVGVYTSLTDAGHRYRGALQAIKRDFGLTHRQAAAFQDVLEDLEAAQGLEQQQDALQNILTFLKDANVPLSEMPEEFQRVVDELITLQQETARAKALMDQLQGAAAGVTVGVPLSVEDGDLLPPTGKGKKKDGRTGGGRTGEADRFGRNLERLLDSLKTEREVVDEWYAESLELLQQANEAQLEEIGGFNEAKLRLEEEYQDKLAKIKQAGHQGDLQGVLSAGSDILGALGATNSKALKIAKAFAAAEILVSTYKGAAKELEKGIFGFKTAALVIARGLSFAAAVKSIGDSGSAAGGGGGGAGASAQAPAPQPQEVRISGLNPDDIFSGAGVRTLIRQIQDNAADGVNIQFAS